MITSHQKPNKYFPHIDGLRGIAVLSVLLFHLDYQWFSGGFIGVDIFFVISGYLITSHIRTAIKQDNFHLPTFYARRTRRLLPALFFTLFICLVVGYFVFPASHFESLGINTLYAAVSVANISFWLDSGYFDSAAILNPLLHTWSLSVEEQFYLVWPALLLSIGKRKNAWLPILLLGLTSLVAAEYWLRKDPAMVFFLTPFRISEFALGGLICWIERHTFSKQMPIEILAAVGLTLIIAPVLLYQETTLFPGTAALVPCVGAALLIYTGANTFIGHLLKTRALLFFGLISYSLYLIHWPIVVFYKYSNNPTLRPVDQILILLASTAIAVAMYLFVETPFRRRRGTFVIHGKLFATGILASLASLICFGLAIKLNDGWPSRYEQGQLTQIQIERGKNKRFTLMQEICKKRGWQNCHEPTNKKENNVLILGDSHAPDALNMFYQAFPEYHYVLKALPGGCPPIVTQDVGIMSPNMQDRDKCIEFNNNLFTKEFLQHYDTIIISVFFQWYTAEHLANTVAAVNSITDAKVIVLGNYFSLQRDMSDLFNQGIDPRKDIEFVESFARFERELANFSRGNFVFISKKELLCIGDEPENCKLFFGDAPFSYDQHHLSFEASSYIAIELESRFPNGFDSMLVH